jgi:hypothetical protein
MSDGQTVQPASVPVAPVVPQGTDAQATQSPQTFSEVRVRELVAAEVEKAKRQLQSEKDKSITEVRREAERMRLEAQAAKAETEEMAKQFAAVDPEAAELARLRSRDRRYVEQESQANTEAQRIEFENRFRDSLTQSLVVMEIDPSDPRIDWAADSVDYVERQRRILNSAARITQEAKKGLKDNLSRTLTDEITAKVKRELGVDSVDTSSPAGATVGTGFACSERQISDPVFWEANKVKILKAQNEGTLKII